MTTMLVITIITLLYAQLAVGDSPSPISDLQTYPHGNPFISGVYGFIDAAFYEPKYWVYSSGAPQGQNSSQIVAYASADLKTWDSPVKVLDTASFNWPTGPIFAAATVRQALDKYYLYFLTFAFGGSGHLNIGVGVASQPSGPYTDARGSALLDTASPKVNDTTGALAVFTDNNGQTSLYFYGSGRLKSVKLNNDMINPNGSPEDLDIRITAGGDSKAFYDTHSEIAGLKIFKRGDSYYLIFKHFQNLITQAKAQTPNGPFVTSNTILAPDYALASSIGQATVINNTDSCFLVYSRNLQVNDSWWDPRMSGLAYEQISFSSTDNSIERVKMLVHDDFQDSAHDQLIWHENLWSIYSQCPFPLDPTGKQCRQTWGGRALMHQNFSDLDYSIGVSGFNVQILNATVGVLVRAHYQKVQGINVYGVYGYEVGIRPDNKLILGKSELAPDQNLNWTDLSSAKLPRDFNFTSWNTLRVVVKGQSISVYVNDVQMISNWIDASHSWGMTGTYAYSSGAKFNDLWIKPPS